MSSSVSSERAFSQGGITISKRRNWLKPDIVEALQCVKCAIRHDLLFREPAPSSTVEAEWNEDGDKDEGEEREEDSHDENVGEDKMSWDDLLIEDEDDDSMEVVIESDS